MKCFLLLLILSFFPFVLQAQDEEPDVKELTTRERIVVGGNIGLQIGNISTIVVISPTIAYRLSNRFTTGVGLTYQYYRSSGWGFFEGFKSVTHIYGGSVFTRYNITRQFFLHGEYEALSLDSQLAWRTDPDREHRFWEHNYFAGGGYRSQIGEKVFLNLMVLYNFNNNSVVYFQNPIFRVGVDVRL